MRDLEDKRSITPGRDPRATAGGLAPGKQAQTDLLPPERAPVQRKADASAPAPAMPTGPRPTMHDLFGGVQRKATAAAPGAEQVHASAQRGIATSASPLPHGAEIQRSFGRHDISGIQAHTGGEATAAARDMGAAAYATGHHVVLGAGTDLHTVAHEAAHVVQQRAGVHLKGGVGQAGDHHERHADAVADLVVQGKSAEALLDQHAGAGASTTAVQRKAGGDSDVYAEARDLANPNRNHEDQAVDSATVNFYAGLLRDFPRAAIAQAKISVPGAFEGHVHARAHAILAFLGAGGIATQAVLAITLSAGDDLVLAGYLAFLPKFNAIPRHGEIGDDRWPALYSVRDRLTTDALRTRAVAMAVDAHSAAAAQQELTRTAGFDFVASFADHADTQAAAHRDQVVASGEATIADGAEQARAAAVTGQHDEAFGSLSKKQKEDITKGTNKTGGGGKKPAADVLADKQQKLAEEQDFPGIAATEQQQLAHLRNVVGPQEFEQRKREYQQWFASVGFDDGALRALQVANNDMPLASQIVACVQAQPATRPLLLQSSLRVDQLRACLTLSPAALAGLVTAGISGDQLKSYLAAGSGIALLGALQAAGVSGARIQALIPSFAKFSANFPNATERGHLVTLLVHHDVADVVTMFDVCPVQGGSRLACLATLHGKAQSAADLASCFRLCTDASWDQAQTIAVISPCADGSTLPVLTQAVFTAIANQHDKVNHFSPWIRAMGLLVDKGQMTIVHDPWLDLGVGNSGVRTWELPCHVNHVNGNTHFDTFVVHYHPGVSGPTVGNANASKVHLKPNRHVANNKLDYDSAPATVRSRIQRKP